mmetsp:Transcript_4470/g.17955  ORF Transcript_4470/g.17955 Transcript_4470/m.17955 type:complete len:347 (-) Transcript_4470:1830-2870(-)
MLERGRSGHRTLMRHSAWQLWGCTRRMLPPRATRRCCCSTRRRPIPRRRRRQPRRDRRCWPRCAVWPLRNRARRRRGAGHQTRSPCPSLPFLATRLLVGSWRAPRHAFYSPLRWDPQLAELAARCWGDLRAIRVHRCASRQFAGWWAPGVSKRSPPRTNPTPQLRRRLSERRHGLCWLRMVPWHSVSLRAWRGASPSKAGQRCTPRVERPQHCSKRACTRAKQRRSVQATRRRTRLWRVSCRQRVPWWLVRATTCVLLPWKPSFGPSMTRKAQLCAPRTLWTFSTGRSTQAAGTRARSILSSTLWRRACVRLLRSVPGLSASWRAAPALCRRTSHLRLPRRYGRLA